VRRNTIVTRRRREGPCLFWAVAAAACLKIESWLPNSKGLWRNTRRRRAITFAAIFGFRGRIDRVQFILGSLASIAIGAAAMLLVLSLRAEHPGGGGALWPNPLIALLLLMALVVAVLALALALFWIGLSPQARRWRNTGWEPLYVMPALFGVNVVDAIVANVSPALAAGPGSHSTVVGIMIAVVVGLTLLFWPGRPDRGGVFDQTPQAKVWEEVKARAEAAPTPQGHSDPPTAGGFGRRSV
jgi:uncharacterized membrane protein YhaH (DUF805 family)